MIALIVSVCLLQSPDVCKDVQLTFAEASLTPDRCMAGAQPIMARWHQRHPRWEIRRWHCRDVGTAPGGQGI